MDFSKLKKRRSSTNFGALADRVKSSTTGGGSNKKDERIFYPKLDEAKNGYAKIRFIESKYTEDTADGTPIPEFAKLYQHIWKDENTGKWHFHHCATTVGKECPICTKNSELWNTGIKENQDLVRLRKRKLSYYSNIVVVEDAQTPENVGKVFVYKFGAKIFDKIKNALFPEFADEQPFNPFDFWEGATFKLKIRKVEGQTNYDKSEFEDISPLDSDETMKKLYNQTYDLREFVKPDLFDEYDVLMEKAFGGGRSFSPSKDTAVDSTQTQKTSSAKEKFANSSNKSTTSETPSPFKEDKSDAKSSSEDDSDDDIDAYFNKLTG